MEPEISFFEEVLVDPLHPDGILVTDYTPDVSEVGCIVSGLNAPNSQSTLLVGNTYQSPFDRWLLINKVNTFPKKFPEDSVKTFNSFLERTK